MQNIALRNLIKQIPVQLTLPVISRYFLISKVLIKVVLMPWACVINRKIMATHEINYVIWL